MAGPLQLHIPEPTTRPGQAPQFTHLDIPEVGETRRPSVNTPEAQLRDLPYGMVRVLMPDGVAKGPWAMSEEPAFLLDGLRTMVLTRAFEERMFRAHRQGKTSFFMKSTGEEAIGVVQSMVLGKGDMSFPTYRLQGWLLARGYPLVDMMNQIYSNEKDPLKGRQLPILYSAKDYGFYSLSGNVGSRIGHAVGWAMASAFKRDTKIAIGYIGEGSTAEGDFHEALTFASVYRAPCILCVTNNQWAISTYSGIAGAEQTTFAAKALAYGIPGIRVDGNDFVALAAVTRWAAERARANLGPTLLELFTYRASGHSTSDDPTKYRPAAEAEHWPLGDPIERLKTHLVHLGHWSDERHAQMTAEQADKVRTAQKEAEAVGTLGKSKPSTREMFEGVFAQPDWRVIEQRNEFGI